MKLFNKYALSALLITQSLFCGQISVLRTYSLISQGGNAIARDAATGAVVASVPQRYVYDIGIDANGMLTMVPVSTVAPATQDPMGYASASTPTSPYGVGLIGAFSALAGTTLRAGGNYAKIRNIYNNSGYRITVSLRDKGQGKNFTDVYVPGVSSFNQMVPWDQDGNYFTIMVG